MIATACRGDEQANEDEEHGGFFTYALVEGLSGKARSPNGAVYAKGLKAYVEDRVKELTRPLDARHQQRPYFDGSEELMDVPLVKAVTVEGTDHDNARGRRTERPPARPRPPRGRAVGRLGGPTARGHAGSGPERAGAACRGVFAMPSRTWPTTWNRSWS